jgi:DNA (cytosine-5)-methyltransferase 1
MARARRRPLMLDLFCGVGGGAVGYWRAGYNVVGVDLEPQPDYPFPFHQADALTFPTDGFDAIHASPPCQAYSIATADRSRHPDLYVVTRDRLAASGLPWVIENVPGAPYRSGLLLCGSMFGLRVRRHRNFESSALLLGPECAHRTQGRPVGVYGNGGAHDGTRPNGENRGMKAARALWPELLGMPWADWRGVGQAIPPAYTEFVGAQLLTAL